MFEPFPLGLGGGRRSDRHGVTERHPSLALPRPFLDPRDIAAHWVVEEHGPQIPALGHRGTEVQHPRSPEQAGPIRRQAIADAAAGSGEVAKAEADDQAIARRSGRPRLRRLLQSRGGLRSRLEDRPAAGTADVRPRRVCAAGVLAGEAVQVDWSEDWAVIGGERTKLQVAHFKLSYSRAFILRAYPQQTHEMLFDAHNHAFRVLGGGPRRGIYDNMRPAVDKVGRGKERQVNARFSAMVSHFLFEAEFCNPASGWEKGQIEKNVQDARHRLWQPTPSFPSLAALNDWLETRCQELWAQTPHGSHPGMISDAWSEEAQHLMPLPRPFDGFVEYAKRVSPTCVIHLERNRYSVPASFANRPVSVRIYPERIVVAGEGQVICEHRRVFARSHQRKSTTTVFDWRHYLAVIQRKPGALRNGAPFAELPPAFQALQQRMLKTPGGDREMVEILALVLQHDEQAVLTAVELALEAGGPTKTHILNLLHRLIDGKPIDPPVVKPPNALTLTSEPQANVERYDALRKAREARHAS